MNSDVLVTTKGRKALSDKLMAGKVQVLIATGQLSGNLFCDYGDTDKIQWAVDSIYWPGTPTGARKGLCRIIDFYDSGVGVLKAGAKARLRTFQAMRGLNTQ